MPHGYGGAPAGGIGRDRVTQALMNIQNPPPRSPMPAQPQIAAPGAQRGFSSPGQQPMAGAMGGGMPGAMPGMSPGSMPPMSMQGMPNAGVMPGGPQFGPPMMAGQNTQIVPQPPGGGQVY